MKHVIVGSILLCALLGASSGWTGDKPQAIEIPVRKQGGIEYVSGGSTDAEKKAMHKVANRYPMQLVFTGPDPTRELEGVKITVIDLRGDRIIDAVSAGPWFYFNPPSGRYTMKAQYAGESVERTVDLVGRRYIVLEFHFDGG
ncbi:MAG: hypothetical protein IT532_13730 [Burkholderiales bacterium]|nr:hypothetical protein [Burkholderiales bacterium]